MSNSEHGWSDYWQKEGAKGEVFVNAEGESHPALAKYWQSCFESVSGSLRVIDLASGAGSVYAHLPDDHDFELFAADISKVALETLSERYSGVTTVVCSADDVPLDDGSFDLVVSQFGVEYAGLTAFAEAARLVAPGGRFAALCHIRDGYIDSDNRAQLEQAELVANIGFIDAAITLAKTAFDKDPDALDRAQQAFAPIAEQVATGVKSQKKGIHSHLYFGFRQLYARRQHYDLSDITGWLEGMRGELDINLDRLSRMCEAALSKQEIDKITELFEAKGLEDVNCTPFETPGNKLPVAWNLTARRGR